MLLRHPVLNAPYTMTTALAFEKFMRVQFSKVSFTSCHFGAESLKYNDCSTSEKVSGYTFSNFSFTYCYFGAELTMSEDYSAGF